MNHKHILDRMKKPDMLSKIPLVELAGENRVLIENHLGVLAYSPEKIEVKVEYGKVCVEGENLKLMEMSREQLVIYGRIMHLQLFRR